MNWNSRGSRSVVQQTKTPVCPACGQLAIKTSTLEGIKGSEKVLLDVYACFKDRFFTTVKRKVES